MKTQDLLWLAGGAALIYLIWPKAKASAPFPTTVAPSVGSSGYTTRSTPTAQVTTPTASRMLPDTYEAATANEWSSPSLYEQQAQMDPESLYQSIMSQGLNGYDDLQGTAFEGGWWK